MLEATLEVMGLLPGMMRVVLVIVLGVFVWLCCVCQSVCVDGCGGCVFVAVVKKGRT